MNTKKSHSITPCLFFAVQGNTGNHGDRGIHLDKHVALNFRDTLVQQNHNCFCGFGFLRTMYPSPDKALDGGLPVKGELEGTSAHLGRSLPHLTSYFLTSLGKNVFDTKLDSVM